MDQREFGRRITAFRERVRPPMSQDRAAKLIEMDKSYLQKLESGLHSPSVQILRRMAEVYSCSADELLGISSPSSFAAGEAVEGYEVPAEPTTDQRLATWLDGLPAQAKLVVVAAAMAFERPEVVREHMSRILAGSPTRTAKRRGPSARRGDPDSGSGTV